MSDQRLTRYLPILLGAVVGILLWEAADFGELSAPAAIAAPDEPANRRSATREDSNETPIGSRWWPSRWGKDDQRGSANLMSAARVLEAAKLIRKGNIYQLGRVYERDMPTFPHRTFRLTIPAFRAVDGDNMRVGRDEFFVGEIGQMGTQMDGLGHVGVRLNDGDYYYNGFRSSDIEDAYGLKSLGVENAGVFFARGVLVDVAGYLQKERLEVGYEITPGDFRGALAAQRTTIRQGDVVLIRTGHSRLWKVDNQQYNSGEPGIGLEVAKMLIEREPLMVGADNWGIEVDPSPKNPGARSRSTSG